MKKYIVLFLTVVLCFSCAKEDEQFFIEDHFLNYEIEEVPVTQDYVVGVIYNYAVSSYGDNRYKSLFAKTPVLGEYKNILNTSTVDGGLVVDTHLKWMNKAKIDYLILNIRSGTKANSSFKSDTAYINRILSSPELKDIKIAFSYDYGGLGLGSTVPSPKDSSMIIEYKPDALNNYIKDYTDFMGIYFNHPSYMKVNGKNLVFLKNAYRLWAKNNVEVTRLLKEKLVAVGKDIYLVGQNEKWSPPQRYEHRFNKAVDAIYHDNHLGIATNDLTRLYQFHQVTDQNWKYSKQMFNSWGVEYVPNIGPSYNSNLNSGNAISPYYNPYFEKDPEFFKKYCNVGKSNSDKNRLIIIESWNTWSYDLQIEPAKEYGEDYLDIVRNQFKVQ